jgi:hypothetical protein
VVALLVGAGVAYALTQAGGSSNPTTGENTHTTGITITTPTRTVTTTTPATTP